MVGDFIVVGPSHVVRLKQIVSSGGLPGGFNSHDLFGLGGAPVWSKQLLETAISKGVARNVFLIVGDFRFGNVAFERGGLPDQLFVDGYTGISLPCIGRDNDKFLLARCVKALEEWTRIFGDRLKLIFWDLFCRQIQDRLAGKYIQDKLYKHPAFNLIDVQQRFLPANLIDLSILLKQPMHQVVRLLIDRSNHPSQAGYLMLQDVIAHDIPPLQAYLHGVQSVADEIGNSVRMLRARRNSDVVITGKSIWIDTLMRYLGPDGAEKIAAAGVSLMPLSKMMGHPRQIGKVAGDSEIVYISSGSESFADLRGMLEGALQTKLSGPGKVVPWEPRCTAVIQARNEIPRYVYPISRGYNEGTRLLTDAEVELGPVGYPTMRGIVSLLDEI